MKTAIAIIAVLALAFGGYQLFNSTTPSTTQEGAVGARTETGPKSAVADGTYGVNAEQSEVRWAGKKPLIEGYVNSGSLAVTSGTITVADQSTATGEFTIGMDTLSVSATPTKPGQENALEGHLKGSRWFDVATYPTASFEIVEVTPRADSDTTFVYDVRGNLTMKGQTHELSFPATIYSDEDGMVHAQADLEFDRTKWGITAGSGSFFDNLADNAVDDMVGLSFHLVAQAQ